MTTEIAPSFASDHALRYIMFNDNCHRGTGFWRMNTSILDEIEYKEGVVEIINKHKSETYDSSVLRWEMIKLEVRGHAIQFCSRKKKVEKISC